MVSMYPILGAPLGEIVSRMHDDLSTVPWDPNGVSDTRLPDGIGSYTPGAPIAAGPPPPLHFRMTSLRNGATNDLHRVGFRAPRTARRIPAAGRLACRLFRGRGDTPPGVRPRGLLDCPPR